MEKVRMDATSTGVVTGSIQAQPVRDVTRIIARNSAWVMGSQLAIRVMGFLFTVYVVRRLGDAEYGKFATVMAFLGVFAIFSDFGMTAFAGREATRHWEKASQLLPNAIALRLALSIPVVLVATASATLLGYSSELVLGVLLAGCGLFVYAFQTPLELAMLAKERLDYISLLRTVSQVTFFVAGALLLVAGAGFIGLIGVNVFSVAIGALLLGWVAHRRWGFRVGRVDVGLWKLLVLGGVPFGVKELADQLLQRFDQVLLSTVVIAAPHVLAGTTCTICLPPNAGRLAVTNDQLVGWYAVAMNLTTMFLLVAQSIASSMYPTLVREYERDPEAIRNPLRQAVKYLTMLSLPIAVGATVLADQIILRLYGEEFTASIMVLRILIWSMPLMFFSELLGRALGVLRKERSQARFAVASAGVVVLLNLLLVPSFGLPGAATAFVIGRAIIVLFEMRLTGVRLMFSRATLWVLARVAMAAAFMGVVTYLTRDANVFLVIFVGMVVYALGLVVLGAMRPSEFARLTKLILGR